MKSRIVWMSLIAVSLLSAEGRTGSFAMVSLHPLYTPQDVGRDPSRTQDDLRGNGLQPPQVTFDPALIGTWNFPCIRMPPLSRC